MHKIFLMKDTKYTTNLRRAKGLETVRGFSIDESSERVWEDINEETGKVAGKMTVVSLETHANGNESFENEYFAKETETSYFSP